MSEFLTRQQERELVLLHKATKDRKRGDRIKAILLLNRGYEYEEIARILLISERTIQNWEQFFRSGGIEGLLENRCIGTTPKLSSEQREALDHQLQERIYLTAKEVCAWVRKRYGVGYGVAGMQKLLKRMGYWYKKPKVVPGKANKEKQEQYLQAYRRLRRKKRKADRVYFMDGMHPTHNVQPAYGWMKRGKERKVLSNTGRKRITINGAYAIEDQRLVIVESERSNAQSTITLLAKVLEEQQRGRVYVVADNARYHRSKLVQEYVAKNKRLELVFLPPYSPNLNVIERLWKFYRKKVLYNQYYETFAEFREKTLEFFKNFDRYKPEAASLLTDNFQVMGN